MSTQKHTQTVVKRIRHTGGVCGVTHAGRALFVCDQPFAARNAKRLVDSWNACASFDDPEATIQALVDALKTVKSILEDRGASSYSEKGELLFDAAEQIEKALALAGESK